MNDAQAAAGEDIVADAIRSRLARPCSVVFTENRISLISVRSRGPSLRVRAHRMFLNADPRVLDALALFVCRPSTESRAVLRQFIRAHAPRDAGRCRSGAARLISQGTAHDLGSIFDRLNREYFGGSLKSGITFGRQPLRRRVRHIRLGLYLRDSDTIIISPRLDRSDVPEIFVSFIVYHEMLHAQDAALVPSSGRLRPHTAAFHTRERMFREYPLIEKMKEAMIKRVADGRK